MLQSSLRSKTSGFKDHVNRKDGDVSLKDATAKARTKKYGNRKTGKVYMTSLSISMSRHGFIQHFGVDNTRSGSTRNRTKPRNITYSFKSHVMRMKAQPFINEAVKQSGVVGFVMENVSKLRSEELLIEVKKILENK